MAKSLRITPTAVLQVTGEDAEVFLQGQFSQDLRAISPGESRYGLWLDRKGRVQGDAIIGRPTPEVWRIASVSMGADGLRERLDAFVIADDVYFADETADWMSWRIWGEGAGRFASGGGCSDTRWVWQRPSLIAVGGEETWCLMRSGEGDLDGTEPVDAANYEYDRIAAGIPRVGCDVTSGDLPQEAGLESVAVSFNKGCYLGQEVMARIQAMGRVRRGLVGVGDTGAVPEGEGSVGLWQGERQIGELRSRVADREGDGWIGLAMVNLANLARDQALHLGAAAAQETCRIREITL